MMELAIRPATDAELDMVRAQWARVARGNAFKDDQLDEKFVGITKRERRYGKDRPPTVLPDVRLCLSVDAWQSAFHLLVDELIAKGRVDVATLPDVPRQVLGWIAHGACVVHFVFVQEYARGKGVARHLLEHVLETMPRRPDVTHQTEAGRRLLARIAAVGPAPERSDGPPTRTSAAPPH